MKIEKLNEDKIRITLDINDLEEKLKTAPEKREAQKTLASEVVKFLHGEEELNKAIKLSETLFTGNVKDLTDVEIINDENHIVDNSRKNHIIRRGKKKYYLIKIS